jgi:site-specific recombinase XerD
MTRSRSRSDRLLALVESYFNDHLRRVRGASTHTIRAYGHALRLFFLFLAAQFRRPVSNLGLDDIVAERVLAFLDHVEVTRGNQATTRNCRLAAIRGFVEHLLRNDISRAEQYRRILAIRAKRARQRSVEYLEPEHVQVLLDQPDRRSPTGLRDYALLIFLYNTGARISEALGVTAADLHLGPPRHVRIRGKGSKERICPLWKETATALGRLIEAGREEGGSVFRSATGRPLSRDGAAYLLSKYVDRAAGRLPALRRRKISPHVLRHSCAVALLQAGVDLTVIRDYLGHASVATTGRYIATNVEMKREVLQAFWQRAGLVTRGERRWRPAPGVIGFLASL